MIKLLAVVLLSLLLSASSFAPRAPSYPTRFVINHRLRQLQRTARSPSPVSLHLFRRFFGGGDDEKGSKVLEKDEATTTAVLDKKEEEAAVLAIDEECVIEEEKSEAQKLMQKVKDAGTAGVISYALWELGFWFLSVPVVIFGYYEVVGHWPDLTNKEDTAKLGAEAFAFVNFARFAVPLRIGLALSTTPWIQDNVVDKFFPKKENENCMEPNGEDNTGIEE